MKLLEPIHTYQYYGTKSYPVVYVRAYDEDTDLASGYYMSAQGWPKYRAHAERAALSQLESVVWAMRKYDIPPSWETAYYRVAGKWPEGMQI